MPPTSALPGSAQKLALLAKRAAAEQPLFCADDASLDNVPASAVFPPTREHCQAGRHHTRTRRGPAAALPRAPLIRERVCRVLLD